MEVFLLASYRKKKKPFVRPEAIRLVLKKIGVAHGASINDLSLYGAGYQEIQILCLNQPPFHQDSTRYCPRPVLGAFVCSDKDPPYITCRSEITRLQIRMQVSTTEPFKFQTNQKNGTTKSPEGIQFRFQVCSHEPQTLNKSLLSLDSLSCNKNLQFSDPDRRLLNAILGDKRSFILAGSENEFSLTVGDKHISTWQAAFVLKSNDSSIKLERCLPLLIENTAAFDFLQEENIFRARRAICGEYGKINFEAELAQDRRIDEEIAEILVHPQVKRESSSPAGQGKVSRLIILTRQKLNIYEQICELFPEVLSGLLKKLDFHKIGPDSLWGKNHSSILGRCTVTQVQFLDYLEGAKNMVEREIPPLSLYCALVFVSRLVEICQKGYAEFASEQLGKYPESLTSDKMPPSRCLQSLVVDPRRFANYQHAQINGCLIRIGKRTIEVAEKDEIPSELGTMSPSFRLDLPYR